MNQFKLTAIALAAAQIAFMAGAANAQTAQGNDTATATVVVTGQRASLENAQKIKQNADEIVDSIVAEDIGKLPDKSVTEVLQRVVGVTIDRTMSRGDPEHYSVEGSGVSIRGLSYVRSELNGRDSFSANGGRSLNFEDVPPELMAGVDIYKNPSAEQIEGAIGGLVNLRTALPFDFKGAKVSASIASTYSELKKGKWSPAGSILASNRWKTGIGEIGALIDIAHAESGTRTDAFQVEPYYPRSDIVNGKTVWVPKGAQWRTLNFNREREGFYGALQWKKDANLRSHVTYFKSKYEMQWDEQAIFASSSPYNIRVSPDATYGPDGRFLTGTLTSPSDGGINFGDDTRISNRKSDTTDIAWNIEWRANDRWTFTSDLQRIKAKTHSLDSTVATGVQLPEQQLDLTGSLPRLIFNDAQRAYIADPAHYYWNFTMEHMDRSVAESKAWKGDAKYTFDHPVLRDLRFGLRFTKRDSTNELSNPDYNWSAITATWMGDISHLAYLSDPRFAGNTHLGTFNNFFNGKQSVPSVVFPNVSLAEGYPASYEALHKYHDILCAEYYAAKGQPANCAAWTPAKFGGDPAGINEQSEKTGAFYTQLRFGWDDVKYPIDGNVGVRYVKTDMEAHGYTVFNNKAPTLVPGYTVVGPAIPNIPASNSAQDYENSYHNVLPSLNLRMKARDNLQFRFAAARAISRPDFKDLQGYATVTQDADVTTNHGTQTHIVNSLTQNGEAKGNPLLKPIQSDQFDLTGEWYFGRSSSLTVALFHKRLKDVIVNQTYNYPLADVNGTMYNFSVTGPVNGAKGRATGIEIAYQQYFDKLPGALSGLGVQANYTYVDSSTKLYKDAFTTYCSGGTGPDNINLNQNGCDTDGRSFGNLPLQYLSKNSYNLALLYDYGKWSARAAWSWRSKNLQGINVNGTRGSDGTNTNPNSPDKGATNVGWALPTWADAYGQLDASVSYQVTDKMQVVVDGQNLTDAKYKQLMQQGIGLMGRAWFVSGRRYSAQLRYAF
ncbi:TonB-dependent receptor [Pseudoduganella flava]|uniref:TonB-dependent receptor n=1 Tax=Pseudoduganella flava TaxID=871742 RepID=A0A562PZE3_9BURK|nr:TonB-dependent receptor [Pseudoduganella flava]QGZ38608.1 TonB-dependent receptor [Pseudoduganella flava]TWI49821.1 TonB-dependent receptor [Pseudoduganella flava]